MASFGERLKREREKRSFTLDEVSNVTKISTRSLRALEEEKFDQLPGGIFNKGFVRAYAKHLGIDDEQAVADYLEAAGEAGPDANLEMPPLAPPPESSFRPKSPSEIPWGGLTILLLLAALGVAGWGYYSHRKQRETPPPAPISSSSSPENMPSGVAGSGAQAGVPADSSNASAGEPGPTAVPRPAADSGESGGAQGFDLLLYARQEVWVSIAQDSQPASEVTLNQGESRAIHAAKRVVLKVGNAAGLDISFNGKLLPRVGDQDQVRMLAFTRTGLEPAPASAPPNN